MLTMEFDYEKLAEALLPKLREEMQQIMKDASPMRNLPPLLTRAQLMDLLHIGPTTTSELLKRPGFPVCREIGVLVRTDKLFEWIDRHTQWAEDNTSYFNVG
ncbi:DNA-binding protein [Sporosarcina sp. FSL K6-1508]|uniref:DNA-binding protein n=1 Tax=Sporosarcina sp. FSL K6-1508 TaxID=2921553 RepID=UPI0030F52DA6